jgi:hypothetical protein
MSSCQQVSEAYLFEREFTGLLKPGDNNFVALR